jgi:hypothetical protein
MVEVDFCLVWTTIDLHTVSTFVDAEKAPHGHISFGILGDDLQVEFQGVLRLEWGPISWHTDEQKMCGPY